MKGIVTCGYPIRIPNHRPPNHQFIITLPETNSSHLKIDGWNTILSFWVTAHFQGLLLLVFGSVVDKGCINEWVGFHGKVWSVSLTENKNHPTEY